MWILGVVGGFIVVTCIVYLAVWMRRFMPTRAEQRSAKVVDGGKIINIHGFDLWTKFLGTEHKTTPYYVIPGGLGMKSSYLVENLGFIAETNPVIFYDPRGCGRSQSKELYEHYRWENFSDELYALIQTLTPDCKIGLVAHSCGCAILYDFLAQHQELVDKVVLLSCMPLKYEAGPPNLLNIIGHLPPKDPKRANAWFSNFIKGPVMFGSMFYDNTNSAKLDTSDTAMMLCTNINLKINKPYNYLDRFLNFNQEVLVICGNDQVEAAATKRVHAQKILAQFPVSQASYFTESGHFTFIEEPSKFKQTVQKFIKTSA